MFMECEVIIDNWLDREMMLRLALVLSLEEGKDEIVEGLDDRGGVNSKLAVISLPFIKVDANVDIEVFVTKKRKSIRGLNLDITKILQNLLHVAC